MTSEIEELRDRLDSFDDRYAAMKYGLGALNDTVEQLKFTVYNTTRSDASVRMLTWMMLKMIC